MSTKLRGLVMMGVLVGAPIIGCGSQDSKPSGSSKPGLNTEARVGMSNDLKFIPSVIKLKLGERVVFKNTSQVPHNVQGKNFFSRNMEAGDTFTHRFEKPGQFKYVCTLHPGMQGEVLVSP